MLRSRALRELLREQQRSHAAELARRDEMIQSLLDRIQHPDRTPVWREPPRPEPPEPEPFFPPGYQYDPNNDGGNDL